MISSLEKKIRAPAASTFAESDWAVLSGFWHPVAFSSEVADGPFAATLLDLKLVLYRSGGEVVCAPDLCRHRGAMLSLGSVSDGCVVCPYHGARYGADGRCTGLPGRAGGEIPPVFHLRRFPAQERYGLVWICLNPEPRFPLPDWEESEWPNMKKTQISDTWRAAASRHTENFTDVAHFSFVHVGTFGNPDRPEIPAYDVEHGENGLVRILNHEEFDYDDQTGQRLGLVPTVYRYYLSFPFATKLVIEYPNRPTRYFFDVPCPVSARISRIFLISASEDPLFNPSLYNAFQLAVNAEDKVIVQTQRPEELPLDLRDEAHLSADRFSVEFRRRLAEMGLGASLSA
jgi:vanillate O-demethylase monooxygenase subunit